VEGDGIPLGTVQKEVKVASLFEKVTDIPPLPLVTRKILEVIENPMSSAQELSLIISRDPSLTSQILKSANSAFYGYPNQIGTIQLATVILGFSTIRTIAMGACVLKLFQKKDGVPSLIDHKIFWTHSLKCAVACKLLASKYKYYVAGEAFTTGILHDVGRIVLAYYTPALYEPILKMAEEENISLYEAEKKALGFTHADVSGYLLEKWKLPIAIVDAVKHHHEPASAQLSSDLASIVFIADQLSHLHSYRSKEETQEPVLNIENWGSLNMPLDEDATFEQLLEELTQELTKASSFFRILKGEA
jgi:HD-like signal output (HDOD) protein